MSRYWIAACAALVAVFGGLVPVAESASATPASEVRPSACGTDKFLKADGSRYECSFVDNFSGTELNDEKWMVQVSSNLSGFSPGRTCFLDSPNNVFVEDGHLNLVGRVGDLPTRCKTPYRLFFSKYTGGAVVTWDRFSQTYGRFSFRAKYPGTDEAGYNSNIWMSPQKLTYGRWPRSGEIDIAEYWSGHPDMVHPSLHYPGHSRADTAWNCKVPNVGDFHVYTLEWTPTEMRFFYDDALCFTRSWKPWMHPRDGRPFNHPFGLVMSQGIWDPYFPVSKELPKSGTMQIDWVRVWR